MHSTEGINFGLLPFIKYIVNPMYISELHIRLLKKDWESLSLRRRTQFTYGES